MIPLTRSLLGMASPIGNSLFAAPRIRQPEQGLEELHESIRAGGLSPSIQHNLVEAPRRSEGKRGNGLSGRDFGALALASLGDVFRNQTGSGGSGPSNASALMSQIFQRRSLEEERNRAQNDQMSAGKAREAMHQEGQQLGLSGQELFGLRHAPEQFFSNYSQRFRPQEIDAGDSLVYGMPGQGGSSYMAPETFSDGPNRMVYDPANGGAQTIHEGSTDAEHYAASLGLQPGTPPYEAAVQDYVLRAGGPTASNYRSQLEQQRFGNRLGLEDVRQTNRVGLEDQRQGNRVTLRGIPQAGSSGGRRTGSRRTPVTATGPNGQRIRLNPETNQWEPMN